MSEKQVYPSREQLSQWAVAHSGVGSQLEHIVREAVEWAREQTARECIRLCDSEKVGANERDALSDRAHDQALTKAAQTIHAAFNLKESPND